MSVYDYKLVVWNEGTLPEGLTLENLKVKHPSRPRNPLIADVFFKGGLIESWGRGTIKIIEECRAANLIDPIFEHTGGGFQVTIYSDITNISYLKQIIPHFSGLVAC